MDRRLITDLKKRRDNRLNSVREKIKLFYDDAKENKYIETANHIKKSINLLENNLKHEIIGCDAETYGCDYLVINKKCKKEFIEKIIENVREGMEISIENNLKNLKQEFSERFLNDEKYKQDKYISAIKTLVNLEKIKQIDELENDLHEISKDLISCIDYNDKIEAELER